MRQLTLLIALALTACWSRGSGTRRQHGYDRAVPIIAALERFHAERGAYPDSLQVLVPDYTPAAALEIPAAPRETYPWRYAADTSGYVLEFRYVGPGMNWCRYTPQRAGWKCGGYF